jgi:hypothetical protein
LNGEALAVRRGRSHRRPQRGAHRLTIYGGHYRVLIACDEVVNRLRHGTLTVNGDLHGDERLATSQRKWVRRQGGHSAPTSSLARDLLP